MRISKVGRGFKEVGGGVPTSCPQSATHNPSAQPAAVLNAVEEVSTNMLTVQRSQGTKPGPEGPLRAPDGLVVV